MRRWLGLLISGVALGVAWPTAAATSERRVPLTGVAFSPRSTAPADIEAFFPMAARANDVVEWVGDAMQLGDSKAAPETITTLATRAGLQPVMIGGLIDAGARRAIRPLDDTNRKQYLRAFRSYAKRHRPAFLGVGVEMNLLWETSPSDFDAYVALFDAVARAVHHVSSRTKVFPGFQLERMAGIKGGLWDAAMGVPQPEWQLLERFPRADAIGFTTYPFMVFPTPPLEPRLATWSFLYDQPIQEPFTTMGLRTSDGAARPSWKRWREYHQSRGRGT